MEIQPLDTPENPDYRQNLLSLINEYFPEAGENIKGLDIDQMAGFAYESLLALGEDPVEVMQEFKVIEREGRNEV